MPQAPPPNAATPLFLSSGDLIADRRYDYARSLEARGDLAAAADLLAQTVELAPQFASAWFALGDLEVRRGNAVAATKAFAQALAAEPQDRHGARLRLAQLGEGASGAAMSPGYVQALFDQYAPGFDAALRDGLHYRGPELLRTALEQVIEARARPFRFGCVIDLGCGTGLMAAALAGAFDCAIGIDLSPAMIAQAERKQLYAKLVVADMLAFLTDTPATADLVVAADAFVYVADLTPLCRAVTRVLRPDGLLAFTVETHGGADVILGEKLRYAHSAAHVRGAIANAGLDLLRLEVASTRTEAGVQVPGLLATAGTTR